MDVLRVGVKEVVRRPRSNHDRVILHFVSRSLVCCSEAAHPK